MITPNVEELILKLRGQAYTTCRPDQLCDQAADLLQSQAERIKELEVECEVERLRLAACGVAALGYFDGCKDEYKSASLDDVLRLNKRCTDLRAELGDLPEAQAEMLAEIKQLRAQPAESKDAERYRWLRDYLISPSTHFDDLIVSADKADTLDGVIDAAIAKGAK